MVPLYIKLIAVLTAMIAILSAKQHPLHVFGGPAPSLIPPNSTWVETDRSDLIDTPSGNIELGQYTANSNGTYSVHVGNPDRVISTTTLPVGLTLVHVAGIRYTDYFKDSGDVMYSQTGDPAVDSKLDQKNSILPTPIAEQAI